MSKVIIEDPVWQRITVDPQLERARKKLSFHEIRRIINHAQSVDQTGEDDYRAYRLSQEGQPEGTLESLASTATMIETWAADSLPANDQGQVHFARAMLDCAAAEIRAFLSRARAASQEPGS